MAQEKSPLDQMLDDLLKGKSPKEILGQDGLLDELTKRLVERALEGEMTDHLGYEKHAPEGRNRRNSRNGKAVKRVKTSTSEIDVEVPRDQRGPSSRSCCQSGVGGCPGLTTRCWLSMPGG